MTNRNRQTDLAIFVATSGHSGVDRIIANLLPEFSHAGIHVDLLRVRGHGPWIEQLPQGTRAIDLGKSHVTQSLRPLTNYLRNNRPRVLLSDKDRANRTALRALRRARVDTRCFVRLGTTASANLANRNALDAWLERRSLRRYSLADGVIVPSHGAAEDLARLANLPRNHIHVLPNPVVTSVLEEEVSRKTPAPHPWLDDNADLPVILACGSLTPRKDYATLIEAFSQVRARREARLLILGCGKEHERLVHLAERLHVSDSIDFPGFVSTPIPWMKRADVFAHTSRWEGLGIVIIEALACSLPVVAMDCPSGPAEILSGGQFGRLISPGHTTEFVDALIAGLDGRIDASRGPERAREFRTSTAANAYIHALGLNRQPPPAD